MRSRACTPLLGQALASAQPAAPLPAPAALAGSPLQPSSFGLGRPRKNPGTTTLVSLPRPRSPACVCACTRVCTRVHGPRAGARPRRDGSESELQGQSCAGEAGAAGSRFQVLNSLNVTGKKIKEIRKKGGRGKIYLGRERARCTDGHGSRAGAGGPRRQGVPDTPTVPPASPPLSPGRGPKSRGLEPQGAGPGGSCPSFPWTPSSGGCAARSPLQG